MLRRSRLALTTVLLLTSLAPCGAGAAPESEEKPKVDVAALVREGQDFYARGAYAEALRRFEGVIAVGQENGTILYQAGTCYGQAMGNKVKEVELKRRAVPLLEKEIAGGSAPIDSYYYLAATYINDLSDPVKGTGSAKAAVALLEKPKPPALTTQGEIFRAGRLYTFLGKDKEAAGYYERSLLAAEKAPVVDRASMKLALESLAAYRWHAKEYEGAARAYEGLLKLDPTRDRDRHQLGLAYLLAGKPDDATVAWRAAQEDELRTELTYLAAVVRRYVAAGSPATSALSPKPAALDDDALVQKLLQAAEPLRALREKEAKAEQEADEKAEKLRAEKAAEAASKPIDREAIIAENARRRAKRALEPPPDPNVMEKASTDPPTALTQMGFHPVAPTPLPPPSAERIAAEREFFVLLVEYVKRGHLIRNFCFEN